MGRTLNDNETLSLKKKFNVNTMINTVNFATCGKPCGKTLNKTEVAEFKAQNLVLKFNAPQCREYFLKCVYHLSDSEIQQAIELATRPNILMPVRYFNVVTKQMLTKHGY